MQEKLDPKKITCRRMTLDEFKFFVEKQNEEGWCLCQNEAEAVYSIDPNGFFVSEYEGKLVGSLAIINYGEGFKYGTLYTVLKEFRGMGLGPPLFEYGVKQANFENSEECSLGESETHILPIYNKRGWSIHCNKETFEQVAKSYPRVDGIVDLKKVPLEKLYEYDRKVFGYSRESYLKLLLDNEEHYGVAKFNENDEMIGYGIVKKLKDNFYKLAPWFADNKETARDILKGAQTLIEGKTLAVIVLDVNTEAISLMKEDEWKRVFSEYRIYKYNLPKTDFARTYGIGADFY